MNVFRYKAFYKNRKPIEVEAETSYKAQLEAKRVFKAKNSWDVTVVIIAKGEKGDETVTHSTAEFG